jgi:NAD-dependent dihydropyrimidine dehydrogenase PreA subunit
VTYIISEPCIDIKDKSCVDVCPVDCIHEAGRILVIDPEECIDCFAPTEEFFTPWGLRMFGELENSWTKVLTDDGFKSAQVRRFRRKPLVEIEFAPAFEERDRYGGTRLTTRNISRYRRTVQATATHSWVLANGECTDSLGVGHFVPSMRTAPRKGNESYRLGVLHGLVFGDGTCQWIGREEVLHDVPLFGDRVAKYKEFFDEVKFQRWYDAHPGYSGTGVVRAPLNLKSVLPMHADPDYIAGFVDGWIAADGDPTRAGSMRLRSISHEALDWVERVAPLAGYVVVGSGQESNMETNYGRRNRAIRWLYLATRETYWRVNRITPLTEQDDDYVYCAVTPGKHTLTLAGGIYSKNCGACEPECPVEAIFPEDALPDKWNAFVEINYAYDKGIAVVDELTEKYATENNVQNPPLA